MDNSPVELELETSPIYDAPMIDAAKRFAEQMSAYGLHGGIQAVGGWCAPPEQYYTLNGDVDLWVRAHKKQRKRAERAEKKLKKIAKLYGIYGAESNSIMMADLWHDIDAIIDA